LDALVASWAAPTTDTNDYATVNIGQLKNLMALFYNRLLSQPGYFGARVSGTYPWITSGSSSLNDYAMANIGQVKNLFSFDLSSYSTYPYVAVTTGTITAGTSVVLTISGSTQNIAPFGNSDADIARGNAFLYALATAGSANTTTIINLPPGTYKRLGCLYGSVVDEVTHG
jgi:hypothetical protein